MEKRAQTPEELLATYRPDVYATLSEHPAFRQRQALEHLMRPDSPGFKDATAIPAALRAELEQMGESTLSVAARRTSADGTVKLLMQCRDNALVETVVMPYQKRITACISSQAGCPVGCAFCATGASGFRRNLTPAEIVDQTRAARVVAAGWGARLSNIVYMGMGEPLLNLQSLLSSIKILSSPHGMSIGHRSLSVSTIGIPSGILKLARVEPQVNLALSLHAASDRVREAHPRAAPPPTA